MSNKKKDKVLLSKEEVVETLEAVQKAFDVLEFTKGYDAGVYSPMTQNDLMKRLNISATVPDKKGIEDALKDPMNNESSLVSYSQSYYFSSLMYKRNDKIPMIMPGNVPALWQCDYQALVMWLPFFGSVITTPW